MSLAGDLLEGTLLYDARGEAYVQPLLSGGRTFRVPVARRSAITHFVSVLN